MSDAHFSLDDLRDYPSSPDAAVNVKRLEVRLLDGTYGTARFAFVMEFQDAIRTEDELRTWILRDLNETSQAMGRAIVDQELREGVYVVRQCMSRHEFEHDPRHAYK